MPRYAAITPSDTYYHYYAIIITLMPLRVTHTLLR